MEKRDVKPFIDVAMKDLIYKLNFITGYSIKKIGEDLCLHAINTGVGKELAPYFKRDIKLDNVLYSPAVKPKKFPRTERQTERISLKLSPNIYEYAYSLSFAIGCSIAKVVAYFMERSMNDYDFLDLYVSEFLSEKMGDEQKDFMQKIIDDVNNDYLKDENEDHNITALLLFIVDEYKAAEQSVDSTLHNFIS